MLILEVPLFLPRYAFSPRNAARAGDVWRGLQEAATEASSRCGWPPSRYAEEGNGFVVRSMTVVHHRETAHGERLRARTWIREFRRRLITWRELRVDGKHGPLADATQEWVHVSADLKLSRAPDELIEAFVAVDPEPPPTLPAFTPREDGRPRIHRFRARYVDMDPLGHANHPAYVDWCDEATSVAMAAAGLDPVALQPVAEEVRWRTGVLAPEQVEVRSRVIGTTDRGEVVLEHAITREGGVASATATTVRRLAGGGSEALLHGLL